jgi:hypothetical protein
MVGPKRDVMLGLGAGTSEFRRPESNPGVPGPSPGMTTEFVEGRASDLRQAFQICLQHVALEDQVGEFAVALDLDQAGGFQLFHVV